MGSNACIFPVKKPGILQQNLFNRERQIRFNRIRSRFLLEAVIQTFLAYLCLLEDQGFQIYARHHDFQSSSIDPTQFLTKDRVPSI